MIIIFTIIAIISLFFASLFLFASQLLMNKKDVSYVIQNIGYSMTIWSLLLCFITSASHNHMNKNNTLLILSILTAMIGVVYSFIQNTKRNFQLQSKFNKLQSVWKTNILVLLLLAWCHKISLHYYFHIYYPKVDMAIYGLSAVSMLSSVLL